jgi:hypothetical protein
MIKATLETTETTHPSYRIESRKPGQRRWVFRPATWTSAANLEDARKYLRRLRDNPNHSPGWEFRIVECQVTTIRTPWIVVAEEEEVDGG